MFSPTLTLTACKLLLPFLICLHPTRVIAIYTKTTHPSSLGHGGCIMRRCYSMTTLATCYSYMVA